MGNTHTQEASVMRVSQASTGRHTAEPQLRAAAHGTVTAALAHYLLGLSGQKATEKSQHI